MFYEPTEVDIEMAQLAVEAGWWQNLASRAYAAARKHPNHSIQRRAAHAAHMARRALRTLTMARDARMRLSGLRRRS